MKLQYKGPNMIVFDMLQCKNL